MDCFRGSWRSWPRPAVSIVDGYERPLGLQSPFQFGYNGGMIDPAPKTRWYRLTPDRVILGLLVVVCLLWLSERFGWLPWHKGYAVLTALAVVGVTFVGMLLWFIVALVFRWRFQFSIRSLLVMVVVVAVPCSWLMVAMKAAREQREPATKMIGMIAIGEPTFFPMSTYSAMVNAIPAIIARAFTHTGRTSSGRRNPSAFWRLPRFDGDDLE